ncbi:cytochrome c oxidase assembly protein [Actinokineospora sp. 24-640]
MTDHPHPGQGGLDFWVPAVLAAAAALAYLLAAARARTGPRGWSRWRSAAWVAGCAVVAVAVSPVLGEGGDPRAHMARHLLLGMIAPLGLVLAAPVTLLLRVRGPATRRRVGRVLRSAPVHVLGHPVAAAVLSVGGLYAVMLTPLHTVAETHPVAHHALHLHYLVAGYLFTWSIAGPDPAPRRPAPRTRLVVLVLAAAAHAVLAKALYARADTLPWAAHHDAESVAAAAELMYYGGDLAELLLAAALFAAGPRVTSRLGPSASRRAGAGSPPRPRRSVRWRRAGWASGP